MITQSNKAESIVDVFDYVIVGAGPSAIGIIRGLLETVSRNNNFPSFSIAIVERGYGPPHALRCPSSNNCPKYTQ